jgi:hypothetical protein
VIRRIAKSMLGRLVMVRIDSEHTLQGVVTEVKAAGGQPKVVVQGLEFNVDRVLMVVPPDMQPTNEAAHHAIDPGL